MIVLLLITASILIVPAVSGDAHSAGQELRSHRSKRDYWSVTADVHNTATCQATVRHVSQECLSQINPKRNKIPKDEDHQSELCCAFTEYRKCVRDRAFPDCGSGTTNAVDEQLSSLVRDWARDCSSYDYYSPACLFFAWYTYVTLGFISLLVLCCCCCVCFMRSCCCCC